MRNKNFSVFAYSNGITLWLYKDFSLSIDEMEKEGFFDNAKTLFNIGDIIYLVAADTVKQCWVKTVNPVSLEDFGE